MELPETDVERRRKLASSQILSWDQYKTNLSKSEKEKNNEKKKIMNFSLFREIVSQNKKRFHDDRYNLDLSYITDRVIAMGFPAENIEGIYRNPMKEVQNFLEEFHKDTYWVYNLCSEREYDINKFNSRVSRIPIDDHNVPTLPQMCTFAIHLNQWLDSNPEHVGVVHCKAGKGRTGVMICAFLLYRYRNKGLTTQEALDIFDIKRTSDKKGVTIPSQRRFVEYFYSLCSNPSFDLFKYNPSTRILKEIKLHTIPNFDVLGGCDPYFTIKIPFFKKEYSSKTDHEVKPLKGKITHTFTVSLLIQGETRFEFFDQDLTTSESMFYFWIHSDFITKEDRIVLQRQDLDGRAKSKKDSHRFHNKFYIVLTFEPTTKQ